MAKEHKKCLVTLKQVQLLAQHAPEYGFILAKHLPDSSRFHSKKGNWKNVWIEHLGEDAWPKDGDEMMSACHIVDVMTRRVYLYPMPQRDNAAAEGHEDEFFILASATLLVEFNLNDADCLDPQESPKALLNAALQKISFL